MDEATSSRKRKRPSYLTEDYSAHVSDDGAKIPMKKVTNFSYCILFTKFFRAEERMILKVNVFCARLHQDPQFMLWGAIWQKQSTHSRMFFANCSRRSIFHAS